MMARVQICMVDFFPLSYFNCSFVVDGFYLPHPSSLPCCSLLLMRSWFAMLTTGPRLHAKHMNHAVDSNFHFFVYFSPFLVHSSF